MLSELNSLLAGWRWHQRYNMCITCTTAIIHHCQWATMHQAPSTIIQPTKPVAWRNNQRRPKPTTKPSQYINTNNEHQHPLLLYFSNAFLVARPVCTQNSLGLVVLVKLDRITYGLVLAIYVYCNADKL